MRDEDIPFGKPPPWSSQPWSEFRDEAREEIRFLIRGLWPEAALGFVAAPPKRGKTWVMLAAAIAIATGRPLFGEYEVIAARPVLYIALEGARAGIRARIGSLARGMGIDPDSDAELERLHVLYRPRPFNLADPELSPFLVGEARRIDAAIVFVDVLRQAARGIKESSAEDFATIRDALEPLHAEGRSAALAHHFGKLTETQKERTPGERMVGSGAMEGALDVAFYITKSENGARRLRIEFEAKDFATPEPVGVSIMGTGTGEHGGFRYLDRAEFVIDPSAAEDRDFAAELEELFENEQWRTEKELASDISGNKDVIAGVLARSPERFVRVSGDLARLAGRSSTAKPWGTRAMFDALGAVQKVAPSAEPPEPPSPLRGTRQAPEQVAPRRGDTPEPPARDEQLAGSPPEPPEYLAALPSSLPVLDDCLTCGGPLDGGILRCPSCTEASAA